MSWVGERARLGRSGTRPASHSEASKLPTLWYFRTRVRSARGRAEPQPGRLCSPELNCMATAKFAGGPKLFPPRFLTSLTWVKSRRLHPCDSHCMSEKPMIDAGREKILSLAGETRFAPNGIVSRTLLRTAHSRVVLFGFAEGQELTEHTSTRHAVIQILSGECELTLAGQPHSLKSGDLVYMPPHLPHAVLATRQFSMLLTLSDAEPGVRPSPGAET